MKTLLIILFFISSFCNAQDYLGISKTNLYENLKKNNVAFKEDLKTRDFSIDFTTQDVKVKCYFQKDTVAYYTLEQQVEGRLNQVIESFKASKFQREKEFMWINYEDKRYPYVIYEIKKNKHVFLTTISK